MYTPAPPVIFLADFAVTFLAAFFAAKDGLAVVVSMMLTISITEIKYLILLSLATLERKCK